MDHSDRPSGPGTQQGVAPPPNDRDNSSRIRWSPATRKRYENWYGMINHQSEPLAFWFRYTLLAPKKGCGEPEGRLWSIFFDKNHPDANFIFTTPIKVDDVSLTRKPFSITFKDRGEFRNGRLTGRHASEELSVEWDLTFEPCPVTYPTVASKVISVLIASSRNVSPNNNIRCSGALTIGDRTIQFEDAPGHQGHTWGKKMQNQWVWSHCNSFTNDPEAVFEGVSLHKGGKALASLYLKYGGRHYFLNRVKHLKRKTTSDFGVDYWKFSGVDRDLKIEGEFRPDPEQIHHVRYQDVDQSELFNRNSCLGSGTVKVFRNVQGEWKLEKELVSEHTVAFEYVDREKDDHHYLPEY